MGYVTITQIPEIEKEREKLRERQQREEKEEQLVQTVQSWNNYVMSQNLFYDMYALSPLKSGYEAYKDFEEGNYGSAAINSLFTVAGISELRGLGVFNESGVASLAWDKIWESSNFIRGTLVESKLANTVYKGYEHLASTVSEFFPTIDFYKDGLGISLKSVNSKANFAFKNIIKNIDDLAEARQLGAIQGGGVEKPITQVRLDIAIPKGYDRKVLAGVEQYARQRGIQTNIFETE